MIEYITTIILVIAYAIAVYIFMGSFAVFVINITIIGLITARMNHDIKKEGILYYLISATITAFIFIFRNFFIFPYIFEFFEKALVLQLSLALIFIFAIAYLVKYTHLLLLELLSRDKE